MTTPLSRTARLFSASYTVAFVLLAIVALPLLDYNMNRIFLWFLLPFYVLSLLTQYVLPKVRRPLEKGELADDLYSNAAVVLMNTMQTALVAWFFSHASSSLLISAGWVSPHWAVSNLPFPLQVLACMLIFDFFFYTTHRLAHEVPFLWRLHSVHHCAHRVTFLNAYRAHPLDAAFRRFVPLAFMMLAGPSHEGFVAAVVLGTVLATITHLNTDLRHGWLNLVIGTNEVHRWHHSSVYREARNFGVFMIWDHLFGTYFVPRDRDMPAKIGLSSETGYPVNNYWQQLLIPFRWSRLAKPATPAAAATDTLDAGATNG